MNAFIITEFRRIHSQSGSTNSAPGAVATGYRSVERNERFHYYGIPTHPFSEWVDKFRTGSGSDRVPDSQGAMNAFLHYGIPTHPSSEWVDKFRTGSGSDRVPIRRAQ